MLEPFLRFIQPWLDVAEKNRVSTQCPAARNLSWNLFGPYSMLGSKKAGFGILKGAKKHKCLHYCLLSICTMNVFFCFCMSQLILPPLSLVGGVHQPWWMWIKRNPFKPNQFYSLIDLKDAKTNKLKFSWKFLFACSAVLVLRRFLETLKCLLIQKSILGLKPDKTNKLGQLLQQE